MYSFFFTKTNKRFGQSYAEKFKNDKYTTLTDWDARNSVKKICFSVII